MKSLREHTDFKTYLKIVTTKRQLEGGHTERGRSSIWTGERDIIPNTPEWRIKYGDVKLGLTHRGPQPLQGARIYHRDSAVY